MQYNTYQMVLLIPVKQLSVYTTFLVRLVVTFLGIDVFVPNIPFW